MANGLIKFNYDQSQSRKRDRNISGEIKYGYFVSPDYPDKSGFYNGFLAFQIPGKDNQTQLVNLFVSELQFSISLSGESAQSKGRSQFYAHNLTSPEIRVTCQTRSSFEQAYIAEFIRETQIYLSSDFQPSNSYHGLVNFVLNASENGTGNGFRVTTPNYHEANKLRKGVIVRPHFRAVDETPVDAYASSGNHMGPHKTVDAQCYITSVSRLAEVGINMYEFQFSIELFDLKERGGLPFSSLTNNDLLGSSEGKQWAYENLDVNKKDYIGPTNISVSESKLPHQQKKAPTPPSNPNVAPPHGGTFASYPGDVSSEFI